MPISEADELREQSQLFEQSLIELAVDAFRFHRAFLHTIEQLDLNGRARHLEQADYFSARLSQHLLDAGVKMHVPDPGDEYEAGMAVSVVNLDEFAEDSILIIDQVLEPIFLGKNGIRRPGSVLLREKAE